MGVTIETTRGMIDSLVSKSILVGTDEVSVAPNPFAIRLMHTVKTPDRAKVLSGNALDILAEMREPASLDAICGRTGLSESDVTHSIGMLTSMGAVYEESGRYSINKFVWKGLRALIESMVDIQMVMDPRVPVGMEILSSNHERALFSGRRGGPWTKTAFSVFPDYGVGIISIEDFYTTYDGTVDLDTAFADALVIAEARDDYHLREFILMAYLRNRGSLRIPEGFAQVLESLYDGKKVPGWPTFWDVGERPRRRENGRLTPPCDEGTPFISETELIVLHCLAHGADDVAKISEIGKVDAASIEEAVVSMKRKGLLDKGDGIAIAPNPFAVRLKHLMGRAIGMARYLFGHSLDILAALREPKTVRELVDVTGLSKDTVLRYMESLDSVHAVCKAPRGY